MATYEYRRERFLTKPPAVVWPLASDTAQINEIAGRQPYKFEEHPDPRGRIRRYATGSFGPLSVTWEETYGEWQENRQWTVIREYQNGPVRRLSATLELSPHNDGCRMLFTVVGHTHGLTGWIAKYLGLLDRACDQILNAIEQLVRQSDNRDTTQDAHERSQIESGAADRLANMAAKLAAEPGSHDLAPKLIDLLEHAPTVALRSIRPLALAKTWNVPPQHAIELCLAAANNGILVMGWDLLCPRCREAKSRVTGLHELPAGAHCSSCNIDYQRNFSRNVELTFHPQPWIRLLPEGEFCLLGPASTPHVKLQAQVAAQSHRTYSLSLTPGPYRVRTVEAGGEADFQTSADNDIPAVVASGDDILLEAGDGGNELAIRNETDRPLFFVIEDRNWASDALTGENVIAMPVFCRLCPEQLLRPGDNAEIGHVTIMFTDLVGSTKLYEALGDATAYSRVRDHFTFLSERIERHDGFIVKTVGDAVMAAFSHSSDAVRAALSIQSDLVSTKTPITLKIGLHTGSCIAVTTAKVLDYFGATVNIAARLENQCVGGEVVISAAMLEDPATKLVLAGRMLREDSATLRGLTAPIPFVRVTPSEVPSPATPPDSPAPAPYTYPAAPTPAKPPTPHTDPAAYP